MAPVPPTASAPGPRHRGLARWAAGLFAVAWLALLVVPPALLVRARDAWLANLAAGEVQEDWEEFRRDMRAQTGREGPVQRKVPRSAEPPLRVWLRDHLWLAVTAWVVLAGTLGGFLGMMVAGVAGGRRGESLPENHLGGGRDDQEKNQRDAQHAQQ